MERESRVRKLLETHGQSHLLRFWNELSDGQRASLMDQIESIDFSLLDKLIEEHVHRAASSSAGAASFDSSKVTPGKVMRLPQTEEERRRVEQARAAGEKALSEGKAACFVVAGGQGTRLGYDAPKGCFPIGPVTKRSLFQVHAEKILAASRRCGKNIPCYIMTSEVNDEATRRFFGEKGNFGLPESDVSFLKQGMIPAVDEDGKAFLAEKGRIFTSPNGHGGSIAALKDSGALDNMRSRGVEFISYFQVDNALVKPADPVFIGLHILEGSEMSSKVLRKRDPYEKLGVVVELDGQAAVIEYSDLPDELAEARDEDGALKLWAGSIAIHILSVDFIGREGLALPYHKARKLVPYVDERGEQVTPDEKNGVKFETFIFDALRYAKKTAAIETVREKEFNPLKNATGEDSIDSARAMLVAQYAEWLEACGVEIPRDENGRVKSAIEISPLTAESADELKTRLPVGFTFKDGAVL